MQSLPHRNVGQCRAPAAGSTQTTLLDPNGKNLRCGDYSIALSRSHVLVAEAFTLFSLSPRESRSPAAPLGSFFWPLSATSATQSTRHDAMIMGLLGHATCL